MSKLKRFARNPYLPLEAQLLVGMVGGIIVAAWHAV